MKVKPLSPLALEAARRVLLDADVRQPRDINVEAIAARHGAMVVYGSLETARGNIVRADNRAVIHVDARAESTPQARFTILHELAHHLMHDVVDHFVQCEGEATPRRGRAWRFERQANDFATEVAIPEALGAPLCAASLPTLDDVERLARIFKTSIEMSAIRFVELAKTPCAVTLAVDGRIVWALESLDFSGKIVKGRALHPKSAAASCRANESAAREVPGEAWGGKAPFLEQTFCLGRGRLLGFIVPAHPSSASR